jgi:hypothetical protein
MRFGLIIGVLLVQDAQASKCVPMTLARQFERADAVVVGFVEAVKPLDSQSFAIKAEVTVERAWKGTLMNRVSVLTDGTNAVGFETGQRYLIYLKSVSTQDYGTDRCSGTARLETSQRALRWLGRRAQRAELTRSRRNCVSGNLPTH